MEQDNLGKFSRLRRNSLHTRRLFMNMRAGIEGGSRWWDDHKEEWGGWGNYLKSWFWSWLFNFDGSNSKEHACNAGDPGSIFGVGRSPGEGSSNPQPEFLSGEFHGQRSLMGYSPWGCKESDMLEWLTHTYATLCICQISQNCTIKSVKYHRTLQ